MNRAKWIFVSLGVLIVALYLVTSCKKQVKIDDTVISLKEINDIGELITAEYYGEVLSGLSMIYYDSLDTLMKYRYEEIVDEIGKAEDGVNETLEPKMTEVDQNNSKLSKKELKKIERKNRRLKKRKNRKLLKKLRKESSIESMASFKELKNILDVNNRKTIETLKNEKNAQTSWDEFKAGHSEEIENYKAEVKKQITKNELIYIGRGTVKAGYDLTEITEDNILFSLTGDTIYVVDVDPKLFNVDINPWFYIPPDFQSGEADSDSATFFGFQLVYVKNPKKTTLNEINRVKTECKEILRKDAIDRHIYEKAKENAETSLQGLFSLLSLEPGQQVTKVFISHSKYFYDKVDILYDGKIDSTEVNYLKELAADDLEELDGEFYPYQTLEYQQRILDQFILELNKETLGKNNSKSWDKWLKDYAQKRKLFDRFAEI